MYFNAADNGDIFRKHQARKKSHLHGANQERKQRKIIHDEKE